MPLPIAKLAILSVKQVAKPISKGLKNGARNSDFIKNYLIMPVAQGVNWVDVKVKTTLMGATSAKVYKLNEKVAVEYGAEFISEFFLYALGTGLLLYEYGRSVAKDEAKELKLQQQSEKFKSDLDEVKRAAMETTFLMEEQSAQIRALQRQLGSLHTQLGDLKSKS